MSWPAGQPKISEIRMPKMRGTLLTVLSAGAFFQCLHSATLPPNPCPSLFQYLQDKNGDTYGRVMIENDYSGNYDILVNMSYSGFLDDEEQNIKVKIESTTDDVVAGRLLLYKISFPTQGVIPRLTRIELNNKVYCSDLAEEWDSRRINEIRVATYQNRTHEQKLQLGIITPTLQPPTVTSITYPSEYWQLPSIASATSASLTWESWQKTSTTPTTAAPLPNKRLRRELSTSLSSTLWQSPSTVSTTDAPLISRTWSPWSQQPSSAAPTTSAPMSSSTWQSPSTVSTTDAPLTSRTWSPWSQQPSSAAPTTSAPMSSSTWQSPSTVSTTDAPLTSRTWSPWSQQPSSAAPTTSAPMSSSTWQSPSTVSTTDAPLSSRTWSPWSQQPSSTAPTTSAPMSSKPSMHPPNPWRDWLTGPPSVAATTAGSLIEEFSLSGKECGLTVANTRTSVIDGDDFLDVEFPWLVAIMYRREIDYSYKCTGSLVSNQHVITAGHCVKRNEEIENFLLIFGTNNLRRALVAVQLELQSIIVHPNYTGNPGDSDIAILIVKKKIEFKAVIKPVCLWSGEEHVGKIPEMQGTVVGWWTGEKRKFINAIKMDLSIVPRLDCLRLSSSFLNIVTLRTFCAGLQSTGPCYGDNGAGFVIHKNGKWFLRGVMSTALGDLDSCDIDNYFVFVDIDKVMNWLKLVMM